MTIQSYTDLQAAIANWIARADLTAIIPDFIAIFEADANRKLRVRQQEVTATLTVVSGGATLPADYLSWRRLAWTGSPARDLDYAHPTYLRTMFPPGITGIPQLFTIQGPSINVGPSDDSNLVLHYFQKVPALADLAAQMPAVTTNWLLTTHPDLYLFGSLAEAHGFVKDVDNLALWAARRDAIYADIEKLDTKTRGPASVRIFGPTP